MQGQDFRYFMIHTLSVATGLIMALLVVFIALWVITSNGFSSLKSKPKKTESEKNAEIPLDDFKDA
jgi:hypothetical protein